MTILITSDDTISGLDASPREKYFFSGERCRAAVPAWEGSRDPSVAGLSRAVAVCRAVAVVVVLYWGHIDPFQFDGGDR